ncbi:MULTISPECIES: hypothetical protein [unclassified Imperialibacter]|uniref:hypothetical protein n=1 Tax=unclassified Imperialibacter TaxID=2629706 RepID=UPI00125FC8BA|nr:MULTISPECIES: hypothetical protein [unclassified Imperialibacter]
MKKKELKSRMFEECINKHQAVVNDFSKRIWELGQDTADRGADQNSLSKTAFGEQVMSELNSINKQLQFANDEIDLLYKMQNQNGHLSEHEQAELGAAVATDRGTFFVSASIEQFSVNGQVFVGLSINSPLFQAMKGRKTGDEFVFNGTTYHIKDIF